MKITIDYGHTLSGGDTGANGCGKREQDLTREVGTRVVNLLRSVGNDVHEIRLDSCNSERESLNWRVNKINNINPDLSVSIHFNSATNPDAHGTEIWIGTGVTDRANNILRNFTGLGFTNRGLKDGIGAKLALVKRTNPPAMLVECCFIMNSSDMSKYNADNFAKAIANGIDSRVALNSTVSNNITPTINNTTGTMYRVRNSNNDVNSQAGAFKNIDNARKVADEKGLCVWDGDTCIYSAIKSDDEYNPHLRDLQSAFNKDYNRNIYEDGLKGPQVADMLNTICLRRGSKGNCVSWVQCRTGAGIDGDYGPETERKVREFQRNNGLAEDGVAGHDTFTKLLEIYK